MTTLTEERLAEIEGRAKIALCGESMARSVEDILVLLAEARRLRNFLREWREVQPLPVQTIINEEFRRRGIEI